MSSNAITGIGTIFQRFIGGVWVNLAEINNITFGANRDVIDVTSLDSVGGYREFIAGFRDAGTVNFSLNYFRDSLDAVKSDFEKDTKTAFRITLPDTDGTLFHFEGYVTELPLTIPADDKITVDVTIKVTGEILILNADNAGFPYIFPFILT